MNNAINTVAAANANALTVRAIDNEPRILDTDLAERLGFAQPRDIRKLVKRHEAALTSLGTCATVARVVRGNQITEFYLNKSQAIFITTQSGTATAIEVTLEVIKRFDAYEKQAANARPVLPDFSNPVLAARAWADAEEAKLIAQQKVIELAPKAAFVDTYVSANGALSSRDAGKVFGMSAQRFNTELRTRRIFFRNENTPIQRYVDEGWFIVAPWGRNGQTGTQTRVTPLGMTKLAALLNREDDLTAA